MKPISCDTFVCLPPNTLNNCVIFGKNSDRPEDEVQEIVYVPNQLHEKKTLEKCTYIEIDQVDETYAVILSKPSWMWGAEMGANQFGVCIGNEAVWTNLNNPKEDIKYKLLGMDLVRLGLQRSRTAREAVDIITTLLHQHGQGGPCSETMKNWSYHNSFLLADKTEGWILETAGDLWAAEQVTSGHRNISNSLSIGIKIDLMSPDLKEKAAEFGFWDGIEPFNFSRAFGDGASDSEDSRFSGGRKLLEKLSKHKKFDAKSMMTILRDEPSGICMGCDSSFVSTSSQVSILTKESGGLFDCHFFTGTPDPAHSVFKPFVFCKIQNFENFLIDVKSPENIDTKLRHRKIDRRHNLYKEHGNFYKKLVRDSAIKNKFMELENAWIVNVEHLLERFRTSVGDKDAVGQELAHILDQCITQELEFYKTLHA